MVDSNGSLTRWIYDEIVFFPVVQTTVFVARVTLQAQNSRELLELVFKVIDPPNSQDADGTAEDLARVERGSAANIIVLEVEQLAPLNYLSNALGAHVVLLHLRIVLQVRRHDSIILVLLARTWVLNQVRVA